MCVKYDTMHMSLNSAVNNLRKPDEMKKGTFAKKVTFARKMDLSNGLVLTELVLAELFVSLRNCSVRLFYETLFHR